MNIWSPGDDEYDEYEKLADLKLRYLIIEANNPTSLADFVSTALSYGLKCVGGPVVVNEVWFQAVESDSTETMKRWMVSERVRRD